MKRLGTALVLALVSVLCACGGGGGGAVGGGGGSTNVNAAFVADVPSPGADSVSLAEASSSGAAVTVAVNLTDVSGVYSAGFDLTFDSSRVSFEGYSPGTVLEQGGNSATYAVNQVTAGRIRVGATRQGNASEVNVTGSQAVIRLNFRVTDLGTFNANMTQGSVSNDQAQSLPGITWNAGSFVGS
jgi:hypothetical protein